MSIVWAKGNDQFIPDNGGREGRMNWPTPVRTSCDWLHFRARGPESQTPDYFSPLVDWNHAATFYVSREFQGNLNWSRNWGIPFLRKLREEIAYTPKSQENIFKYGSVHSELLSRKNGRVDLALTLGPHSRCSCHRTCGSTTHQLESNNSLQLSVHQPGGSSRLRTLRSQSHENAPLDATRRCQVVPRTSEQWAINWGSQNPLLRFNIVPEHVTELSETLTYISWFIL